jgi:hypothetical protein
MAEVKDNGAEIVFVLKDNPAEPCALTLAKIAVTAAFPAIGVGVVPLFEGIGCANNGLVVEDSTETMFVVVPVEATFLLFVLSRAEVAVGDIPAVVEVRLVVLLVTAGVEEVELFVFSCVVSAVRGGGTACVIKRPMVAAEPKIVAVDDILFAIYYTITEFVFNSGPRL